MSSKVSIIHCKGYEADEVYRAIKEAVGLLGGIEAFVNKGERILLKPNLLTAKEPEKGATTHPSIVKATIRLVREAGGVPFVGDSPAIGSPRKAAEKAGLLRVCEELGVEFVEFTESINVENTHGRFKSLTIAREALKADGIINLPKVKTHAQMFLTLGVKNLFGCVVGKRKAQWHLSAGRDRRAFARMLLDIYNLLKPRLHIADGVVAMEGNGPGNGDPRDLGIIFASNDGIAMDRVIARVLGAKDEDLPTVMAAAEDGEIKEDIEVFGKPIEDVAIKDFKFPPQMDVEWQLPKFLKDRLRNTLTPRPVVRHKTCNLCKICIETCPSQVMGLRDSKVVINYDLCIRCFCCQEVCPKGAIVSKEGRLARLLTRI